MEKSTVKKTVPDAGQQAAKRTPRERAACPAPENDSG